MLTIFILFTHLLCYIGWLQATIKGGNRSSAATSYLGPEFINRPNLHVLVNSRVTRVLQSNSPSSSVGHLDGPGPLLTTVEYAYSADGSFNFLSSTKATCADSSIYISRSSFPSNSFKRTTSVRRDNWNSPNPHELWYRKFNLPFFHGNPLQWNSRRPSQRRSEFQ